MGIRLSRGAREGRRMKLRSPSPGAKGTPRVAHSRTPLFAQTIQKGALKSSQGMRRRGASKSNQKPVNKWFTWLRGKGLADHRARVRTQATTRGVPPPAPYNDNSDIMAKHYEGGDVYGGEEGF